MASRTLKVAAAQMGTTNYTDARSKTLDRMLALLDDAAAKGAQLVLFPETAFTTFFPRHLINDPVELDSFFEHGDIVTQPQTKPLFDKATERGTDIAVGFAEKTDDGETFNSCVYFHAKSGSILSKYRKIHLPGDFEPFADPNATNQLEKRYFKPGDLGFNAFRVPDLVPSSPERGDPIFGMMICNDRRWAESWRVLGLQGVEVVLCGYNTAGFAPHLWGSSADMDPDEARSKALFHHKLVMQAHSYTNACFSISAARCGLDDGKYDLIGGSCITGPEGELIAEASTTEDEVVYAEINLDACRPGKERTFDFARHRRVEHYSCITEQTGVVEPPKLGPQGRTLVNGVHGKKDKKIRVLLVNPNSTRAMTDACVSMVESQLPSDVIVTGFTAPRPSPSAIEGSFDNVMSAAAAARAVLPLAATHDAVLVACYSDHALIRMLREELPRQPVIGIMEASLFAARTLGGRFGLIAVSERSRVLHEDSIHHYGFSTSCAGVLSCGLGVLDLHEKSQDEVMGIMANVGKRLVEEKGADVLLLGCAGMTPLKPAVEAAVGDDVQVVDGVLAGVHHLVGLVRMGGATAKRGVYKSSAAGRKARGQDWI
ncbi:carbon-nitrogen hydrolase [Colletotrichum higginsianum]|uniref:Carbon-nitrogen hydrolase n=1 Tax=Colletotrichum higginsianum (strain IMI 349063) TaxID=759273 RepID=H1UZU3_COLHI|nr:Carbon-nitrogen hydrolase [Colletotrichum higginsianum IMI 349063]OBR05618.1 Carbon-nitrogen hydrolase [Colletotrichum higginsianum IMI 349063]CCF33494.1 carbon-nitrogen hydrolase [Colletotrichum higginsianum]